MAVGGGSTCGGSRRRARSRPAKWPNLAAVTNEVTPALRRSIARQFGLDALALPARRDASLETPRIGQHADNESRRGAPTDDLPEQAVLTLDADMAVMGETASVRDWLDLLQPGPRPFQGVPAEVLNVAAPGVPAGGEAGHLRQELRIDAPAAGVAGAGRGGRGHRCDGRSAGHGNLHRPRPVQTGFRQLRRPQPRITAGHGVGNRLATAWASQQLALFADEFRARQTATGPDAL